jgi:hypothetical protein
MDTLDNYLKLKNALSYSERQHIEQLAANNNLESTIMSTRIGCSYNCIQCKEIRHKLIANNIIDNGWNFI